MKASASSPEETLSSTLVAFLPQSLKLRSPQPSRLRELPSRLTQLGKIINMVTYTNPVWISI